ncbi:glycosyltransferase [candidate division KSB1 bacterium]|nr:glycosyltransferase [candidate division KSB1 bacterium]
MKIYFACYQPVMLIRGGPRVKIIETKKSLESLGIQVEYFNMWDNPLDVLECDLLHLFSANLGTYSLARNIKNLGVKYVVNPIYFTKHSARAVRTVCAVENLIGRFASGIWTDYGFVRAICRWAEAVLPNTQDEGDLISDGMGIPSHKIHVVHNGVSERFLHGDPELFKKEYGVENFILNVGHIGPYRKNVLTLIRVLNRIDHPAVIIGRITPGPDGEQCLQEATKNKNLIIIDGIDHESPLLASAYAACDVFALPSTFETPGRAAMEAALAGAKIVITSFGGTKEYFKSYAEYVDPYSEDSIYRGIITALNKRKNDALRNHIRENFLWGKIAQRTDEIYRMILKR